MTKREKFLTCLCLMWHALEVRRWEIAAWVICAFSCIGFLGVALHLLSFALRVCGVA